MEISLHEIQHTLDYRKSIIFYQIGRRERERERKQEETTKEKKENNGASRRGSCQYI